MGGDERDTILTMPEVKCISAFEGGGQPFSSLRVESGNAAVTDAEALIALKLWNVGNMRLDTASGKRVRVLPLGGTPPEAADPVLFAAQGYVLETGGDMISIRCGGDAGFLNAVSTLKQLWRAAPEGYVLPGVRIVDWPSVEVRSLSTTFAWYAGYGRMGFDMQLWGFEEWLRFLDTCSDYKINQLNMVLYGFWPFAFPEYPESALRGLKMRVWNAESENWVTVEFMHPNLAEEFLPRLIEYGHRLQIKFTAYIGLNSYSGGYACVHPEKRMKMPPGGKFVNDFDSLCLSDPGTVRYLRACVARVLEQGFDGFDFEESEEAYWYCQCDKCRDTFWKGASTPEETLHNANTWLLKILYEEIRRLSPDCVIGLRAWRQPPLARSDELIASMVASIPGDVVLFWAPGQYVDDREFEKWIGAFGRERIWGRDTEAIGFASCFGRLVRPFKWNGLRCDEEPITQYVEEDIRQHRGSARLGAKGINGYQFEWYGFFMAFFAHAYYGWGGDREPEDFYRHALRTVFGGLADDIHHVMKNMLTIHESQLKIYQTMFPFARNKVEKRDEARIRAAVANHPDLMARLEKIRAGVRRGPGTRHFDPHFKKWQVSLARSRVICDMALASIRLDETTDEVERKRLLAELLELNEKDFDIVKVNYLDVNPIRETGVKSCMMPYHEIKRILTNELHPEMRDDEPIYPGVEALGWLWCGG